MLRFRWLSLTCSFLVAAAQLAGAQSTTGTVRGTVTDSAHAPIVRATVHVSGTALGAVTDAEGHFKVGGIPAGRYTIMLRRSGFAPDSFSVIIDRGATIDHDVTLRTAAQRLAAVTVNASPRLSETTQQALAIQQGSTNIVSALSGDEIRALPNANAAEAAARIPGVSTERDEGEGKFVQIRGTEPRLSNVTIDGVHIPGTEEGDRIPKLDDVPSDLLGAIEVSKTLRADMDADAIGGSVNLVTKIPEGPPRGYIAGQWGQSALLTRTQDQGGLTYGGRVGDDGKLGFLFGGSYDRNNRAINDVEPGWSVDGSGRSYPVEWDQRDYEYGRVRYGMGGDLDYRLSDSSSMWLKGLWSKFYNYGLRYRFDVASGADSTQAATPTGGIGTGATFVRESSNRTPQEQMWGFTGGGKTFLASLPIDYSLNYSGTQQSVTDYRTSPFEYDGPGGNGLDVRYDASDKSTPKYSFLSAADAAAAATPANFQLTKFSTSDGLTNGHDVGGAVNSQIRMGGDSSTVFQFGAKLRDEGKSFVNREASFTPTTAYTLNNAVAAFTDPNFYNALGSGFLLGPVPDNAAVKAWENANIAAFANSTNAAKDSSASFSGSERILAAYGMTTTDFGPLRLNLGLRAEQTHTEYTGHVLTTPGDTTGAKTGAAVITTTPGSQDYLDLFPSAQLRYSTSPTADVRFAVTRAIARPNYSDLAPHLTGEVCSVCQREFGNLSAGNPNLKPQHAWNVDALYEDFLTSSSVISGGVFFKHITDFIYDREFVYNGPVTDFDGYYGTEPANGGSGNVMGVEGDYQTHFRFLPGAWSGLGVDLNWMHAHSSAQILADTASVEATLGHPTTRNAPFPRQANDVGNLALMYDDPRFTVRAAWQYQGANITSYGDGTATANGDNYFYPHSQIDASVMINMTRNVQLQVQGLNLNNAVFGFFNGVPGTEFSVQREYYGRAFIVGVKYGF